MTADLAAFITERLAEAQADAGEVHTRDCQSTAPWGSGPCNCGQPERELRSVTARRAILAEHPPSDREHDGHPICLRCVNPTDLAAPGPFRWQVPWPCPTLRHLATEWAGHPAYQPGWSPEPAEVLS